MELINIESGNLVAAMRINADQNVGVGTTSLGAKLELASNMRMSDIIKCGAANCLLS